MASDLSKLVDSIHRVGIQNLSLLSRESGIPIGTVRYALNNRFPELNLAVRLSVEYDRLGLEWTFCTLEFNPEAAGFASSLLDNIADRIFLAFHCPEVFGQKHFAMFSVPVAACEEFRSFLERLVQERILVQYKLERLDWKRILPMRTHYYDIDKRKWDIDWNRLKLLSERPPEPPLTMRPSPHPDVDAADLLVVKELQSNSWQNISEIAKKVHMNERTARWHYAKHVSQMANSYYVRWLPPKADELRKLIGVMFEFSNCTEGQVSKARLIFNNFPFTWYERGRNDGYYQTLSVIPTAHVIESMKFLNAGLRRICPRWETHTLDFTRSASHTIAPQYFGKQVGWAFNEKTVLKAVLAAYIQVKK